MNYPSCLTSQGDASPHAEEDLRLGALGPDVSNGSVHCTTLHSMSLGLITEDTVCGGTSYQDTQMTWELHPGSNAHTLSVPLPFNCPPPNRANS